MTHRSSFALLLVFALPAGCAGEAEVPNVVGVTEPQDEAPVELTAEATAGAAGELLSAPPCFENEFGPFAEGESCWDESSIVHVTYCQKLDGTKRELVRQILHCEEPNGFCLTLGDKPPWAYLCGPVRGFGKD